MNNLIEPKDLAKFWNLSEKTIMEFTDEKYFKNPLKIYDGKFNFIESCKWMYEKQQKEILESKNKHYTRQELAALFGFKNDKYINELERDFGLQKEGWNSYDLQKSLQWFLNYKEEQCKRAIAKIKNKKPQDELALKNVLLKQIEIEQKEGKLISTELVENVMSDEAELYNISLDSIIADFKIGIKGLVEEDIYQELNQKLKEIIDTIKTKLANSEIDLKKYKDE